MLKRKWWEGGKCPKDGEHGAKGNDKAFIQYKFSFSIFLDTKNIFNDSLNEANLFLIMDFLESPFHLCLNQGHIDSECLA